jgi:chromosomal replication initiator protein
MNLRIKEMESEASFILGRRMIFTDAPEQETQPVFIGNNEYVNGIKEVVGEVVKIKVSDFMKKSRKIPYPETRFMCMYLIKEFMKHTPAMSLKTIGIHFGGLDHSTVIHAVKIADNLLQTDKQYKRNYEQAYRILEKRFNL